MSKLLVLDNAIDHTFYRPVEHWAAAAGFRPASVYAAGGEALPEPGAFTHVILTGSESSIVEPADWADAEAEWATTGASPSAR